MTRSGMLGAAIVCVVWFAFDAGGAASQKGGKGCEISSSQIAFGNYDPLTNSAVDTQSQIFYRCGSVIGKGKDQIAVRISLSTGGAGTFDRRMASARDQLRYNIYLDASRSFIWGDGSGGTQVFTDSTTPNGKLVTVPVFGRVFAAQDIVAGLYLDNLVVTLDF